MQIESERYDLTVAWVEGDDLLDRLPDLESELEHLDAGNPRVQVTANTASFLTDRSKKVVSANAYLGARAIRIALEEGADIVICASPSRPSGWHLC